MKTTTRTVWATNQGRELLNWSPDEKNFTVPVASLDRGELIELGEAIKDALERTLPMLTCEYYSSAADAAIQRDFGANEAAATKEGGAP